MNVTCNEGSVCSHLMFVELRDPAHPLFFCHLFITSFNFLYLLRTFRQKDRQELSSVKAHTEIIQAASP